MNRLGSFAARCLLVLIALIFGLAPACATDLYWVGGSATWDSTVGTKWALTSGGVGGLPIPTSSDNVFIDSGSGAVTVTVGSTNTGCKDLKFISSAGSFAGTFAGVQPLTVSGALTLSGSMSLTYTGTMTLATSTSSTPITSNGKSLSGLITLNATGGIQLQDDMATPATGQANWTAGGIDLNGHNLTVGQMLSNNSGVRSWTSGGGSFKISYAGGGGVTAWNMGTVTNLTINDRPSVILTGNNTAGSRTISMGNTSEATAPSFSITAGSDTIAHSGQVFNLTFSGFTGTLNNGARTVYGDLTFISGMSLQAGASATTFASTSGTARKIISGGLTSDFPLIFNGAGGTFQLQDDLAQGSTRATTLTNGTLDLNNHTFTPGTWALGSGTKVLATATTGKLAIIASGSTAFDANTNGSGFTVTGSGKVSLSSASAKTFVGAGKSFAVLEQAGAGTLTVTGANTFADIQSTAGDVTVTLPASTTTTVSALTLGGTSGHPVTLNSSSSGTAATISKSSGTVSVSNLSIKDSAATGGAAWRAPLSSGNSNVSGNSGWFFGGGGMSLLGVGN